MNDLTTVKSVVLGERGEVITKEASDQGEPLYALQQRRYSGGVNQWFPLASGKPVLSQQEINAADAVTRNKLLLKLKDQKVNLAQAMAERHQVVDMVAKNATRIADMMVNLKRGNLALAADALGITVSKRANARYKKSFRKRQPQAVAGGVLELQYGWRPLLNDIFGAAEVLANTYYKVPTQGRVVASTKLDRNWTETVKRGNRSLVPTTNRYHVEYTIKYVVYFSIANDVAYALNKLGITNPALIAWELTPWSFVADWFIPIGNWISTFDATLGLNFEKGTKSILEVSSAIRYCDVRNFGTPFVYYKRVDVKKSESYVNYTRRKLIAFPFSSFPPFKNPFSYEHAVNAIALLTQLFKK